MSTNKAGAAVIDIRCNDDDDNDVYRSIRSLFTLNDFVVIITMSQCTVTVWWVSFIQSRKLFLFNLTGMCRLLQVTFHETLLGTHPGGIRGPLDPRF